jgi:hypothetical protein
VCPIFSSPHSIVGWADARVGLWPVRAVTCLCRGEPSIVIMAGGLGLGLWKMKRVTPGVILWRMQRV